jgi:hypothetical protein
MKFLIPALLVFAVGCGGGGPTGPKMYPVSGTLTVGGKPIAGINVTLMPADMSMGSIISSGKTNDSGKFSLSGTNGVAGAVAGKYKVVLAAPAAPPAAGASHSGPPAAPGAAAANLPFPAEYASGPTSPKTVEVTNQAVTLDLAL